MANEQSKFDLGEAARHVLRGFKPESAVAEAAAVDNSPSKTVDGEEVVVVTRKTWEALNNAVNAARAEAGRSVAEPKMESKEDSGSDRNA